MKNLAIIPARSGSKRVPNKNIRILNGNPLIWYSVNAAKTSEMFEEIMVSTDSEEYAEIARQCGATVPFIRSAGNASDAASSWDMVREVLNCYKNDGKEFDTVCLLQPTSPLRTANDICGGYDVFKQRGAKAVAAVCKVEHSLSLCNVLPNDNCMNGFLNGPFLSDTYYRLNGALYIVDTKLIAKTSDIYCADSYAYIMDAEHSVDIDTVDDFWYAEFLLSLCSKK